MSSCTKIDLTRNFAAGVALSEDPPLLGFCLGWCSNCVSSESGQIQSVRLLQNRVSNRTPYTPPPYTHCMYTYAQYTYSHRERGGGELNQREGYRGNSSQS
jgi:hypothetical protein